jgi:Ca2+-binding EF-hand superfamily protein
MSTKNILTNKNKIDKINKVMFNLVDKDGSGLIELSELELIMKKISLDMGMELPSYSDIRIIFNTLDTNKSGLISLKEFKLLIISILEAFS